MKTRTLCPMIALSLVACAGEERQSAQPRLSSAEVGEHHHPDWPRDLGRGSGRFIRIDLGPDSFRECQKLSPKFPFDSAITLAQDREQIVALTSCLNAPSMRERSILLIGRADPRGTGEYNLDLGMKRAKTIQQLLVENGIAPNRIEISSEGEEGAVGALPAYSYGYDRRVDVVVKGGTHAP